MEPIKPARNQLVGIALMTYIPDDFVIGGIKHTVKSQGYLYDTEA
jgi:hypothetical protein